MRSRWRPRWLPPRVPCTPRLLWSGSAGSRAAGAARARARAASIHPCRGSEVCVSFFFWSLNPMCFSVVWGTCEGLGGWFRAVPVSRGYGGCVGTAGCGLVGRNHHLIGSSSPAYFVFYTKLYKIILQRTDPGMALGPTLGGAQSGELNQTYLSSPALLWSASKG